MTFAELIEEVRETIDLHPESDKIQNGEIKRLLNLKMREVSLEVGVPTLYVDVPSTGYVTGRFQMPVRFHPEGIKYAEVVEVSAATTATADLWENRELAILSVAEANRFHPKWEDDATEEYSGIPFLIWNPAAPDEGIRPVGITSASYRFLVHAVPAEMTDDDHEPFAVLDYCEDPPIRRSGAMPGYHRILSHFVNHELLQRLGDQRWQAYYARYTQMRDQMYSQIQPPTAYLPAPRRGRRVKRYA